MRKESFSLKEIGKKHPKLALRLCTIALSTGLGVPAVMNWLGSDANATQQWGVVNAQTIDNGTVPVPTPEVPPTNEVEPINIQDFYSNAEAFDLEGRPMSGVTVLYLTFNNDGNNILEENFADPNWKDRWAYSIFRTNGNDGQNDNGIRHAASPGEQGFLVGGVATNFMNALFAEAESFGNTGFRQSMEEIYPDHQLLNGTVTFTIRNLRAANGEFPYKMDAQLIKPTDGNEPTIYIRFLYPSYREPDPTKYLEARRTQEKGETSGILEPLTTEDTWENYTNENDITITVFTGDETTTPYITFSSPTEEVVISNENIVSRSSAQQVFPQLEMDENGVPFERITLSAIDLNMEKKQSEFETQAEIPTPEPQVETSSSRNSNSNMALVVTAGDQVDTTKVYDISFKDKTIEDSVSAPLYEIQPNEVIRAQKINGVIQFSRNHTPNVPHPIDEQSSKLYMPFTATK